MGYLDSLWKNWGKSESTLPAKREVKKVVKKVTKKITKKVKKK